MERLLVGELRENSRKYGPFYQLVPDKSSPAATELDALHVGEGGNDRRKTELHGLQNPMIRTRIQGIVALTLPDSGSFVERPEHIGSILQVRFAIVRPTLALHQI